MGVDSLEFTGSPDARSRGQRGKHVAPTGHDGASSWDAQMIGGLSEDKYGPSGIKSDSGITRNRLETGKGSLHTKSFSETRGIRWQSAPQWWWCSEGHFSLCEGSQGRLPS